MKNYIILQKCSFRNTPEIPFYTPMEGNNDAIDVLASCISYSRYDYKTFEELKHALLNKKVLNFNVHDCLYEYAIAYNIEDNTVECVYIDFYKHRDEDIWKAEILLAEDCVEQQAQFSLDVFLEVAKNIIDGFYKAEQWIIVWQDESHKIYVDPYQLTDEQKEKWKHYIKVSS